MSSSSTSAMMPIPLLFNCGYARVAVYEISAVKKGKSRISINRKVRAEKFQNLFSEHVSAFVRPEEYWKELQSSKFNQHCDFTLDCICRRRWSFLTAKQQYLEFFSIDKWKAVSGDKKRRHTLSQCFYCANMNFELQKHFPGLPVLEPVTLVNISLPSTPSTNEACVTRRVLAELNSTYESVFNRSFTNSVLNHCGKTEGICRKESVVEKKTKEKSIAKKNVFSHRK